MGTNTFVGYTCASWAARTLLLAITLAGAFAASTAHADQSPACDHAALIRAERFAVAAEALQHAERNPALQTLAAELVRAAVAQATAYRALCRLVTLPELAAKADPFDDSDPFQATPPPLVPAPVMAIPVPGIPYLVDAVVEASCPGPDCPVLLDLPAMPDDAVPAEMWGDDAFDGEGGEVRR